MDPISKEAQVLRRFAQLSPMERAVLKERAERQYPGPSEAWPAPGEAPQLEPAGQGLPSWSATESPSGPSPMTSPPGGGVPGWDDMKAMIEDPDILAARARDAAASVPDASALSDLGTMYKATPTSEAVGNVLKQGIPDIGRGLMKDVSAMPFVNSLMRGGKAVAPFLKPVAHIASGLGTAYDVAQGSNFIEGIRGGGDLSPESRERLARDQGSLAMAPIYSLEDAGNAMAAANPKGIHGSWGDVGSAALHGVGDAVQAPFTLLGDKLAQSGESMLGTGPGEGDYQAILEGRNPIAGSRWTTIAGDTTGDRANQIAREAGDRARLAANPVHQAVSNTVKANTPTGSQPVPLDGAKGPASSSPDPQMAWLKEQLKKGSKPQDIGGELFHRIAGPTSSYNAADPRAIHANQLIEKAYGGITGGDVLSRGGLPIGISSSGAYPFGHMTDSANALSDSVGQSPMFRGDFLSRRDDQPQSIRTEARF